ncbi:MAG: exopolysaccharide biosynthesis polyprenyl glycosylphosphotransferase [Schleiferiaceae bacterium]|nr:exopolysaccharide biosynthesis polyprenyl glycosylphosphotransferase [Schleiferiaceae bacterium]
MGLMESRGIRSSEFTFFLADGAILIGSFLLWANVRFGNLSVNNPLYYDQYLILFILVFVLWISFSLVFNVHKLKVGVEVRSVLSSFYRMVFLHISTIALVVFILKTSIYYSRIFLFLFVVSYLFFGTIFRFFWIYGLRNYFLNKNSSKLIATVGVGSQWKRLGIELNRHPEYGYKIGKGFDVLPTVQELSNKYEELWVSPEEMRSASRLADELGIRLRLVPDLGVLVANRTRLTSFGNIPIVDIRPEPLSFFFSSFMKRSFDVFISFFGLLFILSWLTPIIGILIKINSRGSIFYSQTRVGIAGNNFRIWKFRSMYKGSEEDIQAKSKDNRITFLGKTLRKNHLDELPQLWNVFIGTMSLVGPRPHMLSDHSEYTKAINNYGIRHWVRPGMTGLAQARGLTGSKDIELMHERIRADIYYIENWSFILDLKIMGATILGKRKWI